MLGGYRRIRIAIILVAVVVGAATRLSHSANGGVTVGEYVGSTSQGLPISFAVTPAGVNSVQFQWRATCADGKVHTNEILLGGATLRSGSFLVGDTLNTGADAQVSGTVHGSTAFGQLSRSGPSAFGTNCLDTGVTWTAHPQSG